MRNVIGQFALADEIARFPSDGPSGRRAETLLKSPQLRVVLVTMRAGATLQEHAAPGPITIQALRGQLTVTAADQDHDLPEGSLIAIEATVRHSVHAITEGTFLLTIIWPNQRDD